MSRHIILVTSGNLSSLDWDDLSNLDEFFVACPNGELLDAIKETCGTYPSEDEFESAEIQAQQDYLKEQLAETERQLREAQSRFEQAKILAKSDKLKELKNKVQKLEDDANTSWKLYSYLSNTDKTIVHLQQTLLKQKKDLDLIYSATRTFGYLHSPQWYDREATLKKNIELTKLALRVLRDDYSSFLKHHRISFYLSQWGIKANKALRAREQYEALKFEVATAQSDMLSAKQNISELEEMITYLRDMITRTE